VSDLRLCDVSSRAFWSDASPSHCFSFNFSRQAVCFFRLPVTWHKNHSFTHRGTTEIKQL